MPRGILTIEQRERQLAGINSPENRKKLSENSKRMWATKDMTERNKKISFARLGQKHPLWKGDKATYASIHEWIGNNLLKPKVCSICKLDKKLEAHNLSKKYTRISSDWLWVCRSCHNKLEGKMVGKRKCLIQKI